MKTTETIGRIERLPESCDMAIRNEKPFSDFNCGHDELSFDSDDLKALVAELNTAWAGSNYTANDDTFPSEVIFKNGRKVGIAFDGDKPYLTVGRIPEAEKEKQEAGRFIHLTDIELQDEIDVFEHVCSNLLLDRPDEKLTVRLTDLKTEQARRIKAETETGHE